MSSEEEAAPAARGLSTEELAGELLARADGDPCAWWAPGGLTKRVQEAFLEAELTEHVRYEPDDPARHHSGNSRNGTRSKTVIKTSGRTSSTYPGTGCASGRTR